MDDHLLASTSAVKLRLGPQHPLRKGHRPPGKHGLQSVEVGQHAGGHVRVELPSGQPPLATQFDADKLPRSEFCGDALRGDAEKLCCGISADAVRRELVSLGELVTEVGEYRC